MAHGDQEARADEDMGLPKTHVVFHMLGGVCGDEERAAEDLDLRPLVRMLGIFDGEVVQAEFLLQLVEQCVLWFVQADPHEAAVIDGQYVADRIQGDVATQAGGVVGGTIDHAGRDGWRKLVHRAILHAQRIVIKHYRLDALIMCVEQVY